MTGAGRESDSHSYCTALLKTSSSHKEIAKHTQKQERVAPQEKENLSETGKYYQFF